MKESLIRISSGIVYVLLLIIAIFISRDTYVILFYPLSILCIYEYVKLSRITYFYAYCVLFSGLYFLAYVSKLDRYYFAPLAVFTIVTHIMLGIQLFSKKEFVLHYSNSYYLFCYLLPSLLFLSYIPFFMPNYQPEFTLGIFILIWIQDSFAYATGKVFGKNKLAAKISPKKTIEGLLGGMVFTIISAFGIAIFSKSLNTVEWLLIALLVCVFGTLGDLVQSWFKRRAGVKDSGSIMPGHGGIFDRLDSAIFVAPWLFLLLQLFHYVS